MVSSGMSHNHKERHSVVVRLHYFSSEGKSFIHGMFKRDGDVVTAKYNCVAGKGGACSHVAALLYCTVTPFCHRQKEKGD